MRSQEGDQHYARVGQGRNCCSLPSGLIYPTVLAVKGTQTTEVLATIVDDLAAVPHVELLELPGWHACHIENIDSFLEELTRHAVTMSR